MDDKILSVAAARLGCSGIAHFTEKIRTEITMSITLTEFSLICRALSRSALHREHLFDPIRLAAVDSRLAAFVVKRVNDHLEFSIPI
jgi:hypothetical protein